MAQSAIDKIPPGPKLDALTAEKVFGWKNVHKHNDRGGVLYGKRQGKAGHWRLAKVPNYSHNPLHGYAIEDQMRQLGRLDRYQHELAKIARAKNMPPDWASPEDRCRAAIKAVGQYGSGYSFGQEPQAKSKKNRIYVTLGHSSTARTFESQLRRRFLQELTDRS